MSKIMSALARCARHSRKPMAERQRYDFTGFALLGMSVAGKTPHVYLNGDPIATCLFADEIRGEIEVYVEPMRFDPDIGRFVTLKRRGVVGVEIEETK